MYTNSALYRNIKIRMLTSRFRKLRPIDEIYAIVREMSDPDSVRLDVVMFYYL